MTRRIDIQKILAEDFDSKAEAALYLDITERTLERWLLEHRGPPVTLIRKKQFFEKRALAAFKKQRERKRRRRGERVPRSAASGGKRKTLAGD